MISESNSTTVIINNNVISLPRSQHNPVQSLQFATLDKVFNGIGVGLKIEWGWYKQACMAIWQAIGISADICHVYKRNPKSRQPLHSVGVSGSSDRYHPNIPEKPQNRCPLCNKSRGACAHLLQSLQHHVLWYTDLLKRAAWALQPVVAELRVLSRFIIWLFWVVPSF